MTASPTAQHGYPQRDDPLRSRANALFAVAFGLSIAIACSVHDRWPIVVLLVIAPVAEEALFRAGVQDWLLRRHRRGWPANITSSALFVVAHCLSRGVDLATLGVAFPSLALGWLYGRYRCLRLCIATHMLMNILWWSFVYQAALPAWRP